MGRNQFGQQLVFDFAPEHFCWPNGRQLEHLPVGARRRSLPPKSARQRRANSITYCLLRWRRASRCSADWWDAVTSRIAALCRGSWSTRTACTSQETKTGGRVKSARVAVRCDYGEPRLVSATTRRQISLGSVTPCDARLTIFFATVSTNGSLSSPRPKIARAFSNALAMPATVSGSNSVPAIYFLIGTWGPVAARQYGRPIGCERPVALTFGRLSVCRDSERLPN